MSQHRTESLIYDVGMHNGDDTAHYLHLGYNVLAIDASPDLVTKATARFKKFIDDGKLTILNIGIADIEGHLEFYQNKKNSVWNSFHKEVGTHNDAEAEVITVATKQIAQVVEEFGMPHYMKIDIEGNDVTCLDSLLRYGKKPNYISVELSNLELIAKLQQLGYSKFRIVEQTFFLPLEVPELKEFRVMRKHTRFRRSMSFPIRVVRKLFGKNINSYFDSKYKYWYKYEYPFGSSGPFGEPLLGRWLGYQEAIDTYNHYKNEYVQSDSGFDYWVDVHATV
jgi:FkbM family methyltransferase